MTGMRNIVEEDEEDGALRAWATGTDSGNIFGLQKECQVNLTFLFVTKIPHYQGFHFFLTIR